VLVKWKCCFFFFFTLLSPFTLTSSFQSLSVVPLFCHRSLSTRGITHVPVSFASNGKSDDICYIPQLCENNIGILPRRNATRQQQRRLRVLKAAQKLHTTNMYSSTARSTLSLLALSLTSIIHAQTSPPTGLLGDAQIVTTNPAGASYIALLPNSPLTTVRGSLTAITSPSNFGIDVALTLSGLPTEDGPFLYHIHVDPVPADGNCTATLAHLDPFVRGEDPPCDAARKETCQVGDLSGKYGKINGTRLSQRWICPFSFLLLYLLPYLILPIFPLLLQLRPASSSRQTDPGLVTRQ